MSGEETGEPTDGMIAQGVTGPLAASSSAERRLYYVTNIYMLADIYICSKVLVEEIKRISVCIIIPQPIYTIKDSTISSNMAQDLSYPWHEPPPQYSEIGGNGLQPQINRRENIDTAPLPPNITLLGETSLIGSLLGGRLDIACRLVRQGADVNHLVKCEGVYRTPLQLAAESGNIALVKFLVEECGADVHITAPDGELARTLAAKNRHHGIVGYLPAQRGGGWLRWKKECSEPAKRIREAGIKIAKAFKLVLYDIPYIFLFWLPKKALILPTINGIKFAIENRRFLHRWCKKQFKSFPKRARKVVKAFAKSVRNIPSALKNIVQWLIRALKASPRKIMKVVEIIGSWTWETIIRIGGAVAAISRSFLAVLHTVVVAMITFFDDVTIRNIWNGFCTLLRATFTGLPEAVWKRIEIMWGMFYEVLKTLFGVGGTVMWWAINTLWHITKYLPHQVVSILTSLGDVLARGFKEALIWCNPKYSI